MGKRKGVHWLLWAWATFIGVGVLLNAILLILNGFTWSRLGALAVTMFAMSFIVQEIRKARRRIDGPRVKKRKQKSLQPPPQEETVDEVLRRYKPHQWQRRDH